MSITWALLTLVGVVLITGVVALIIGVLMDNDLVPVKGGVALAVTLIVGIIILEGAVIASSANTSPYHAPHCVVVHDYRYCGGKKQ